MRNLTGGTGAPGVGQARRLLVGVLLAQVLVVGAPAARAANYSWTGGGGADTNWSNPANWGGVAPSNNEIGASLTFPALAGHYTANNDLSGVHVTFLSITTQLSDGAYTFTGNPVTIEGPATLANPGSGTPNLVWQIPLMLGANVTMAASGRQTQLQGNIDLGSRNLTFNAGGDIVVSGVISGSGNLIKNNTSALTLRGSNTYSGTTTNNNGALYLGNAAALGSADGGTTIANGALSFAPDSAFTLAEPLVFTGGGIVAYGTPAITGPLTVNAAIEVRAFDLASVLTIASPVSGSGGLALTGPGVVVLSGNATYAGATTVTSGTLQLDGFIGAAANLTVMSGATLRGNGSTAGTCVVQSGGTLAPGDSPGSLGCGGLTMTDGATLVIEISGPTAVTEYDQLVVNGPVSLGGATLSLVLDAIPADGQTFTLLVLQQGQGVTGTFAGLPDGGTFSIGGKTFGINYGESEVVLTAAPGSNTPTATPRHETMTPSPTPTPTGGAATCTGDCDGNGAVNINELVLGVNIALGNESVDRCPAFDADGGGTVAIQELIAAVNSALGGCR